MARRGILTMFAVLALVGTTAACSDDSESGGDVTTTTSGPPVLLNHLQVLGSHNSYHLRPEQAVLDAVAAVSATLAAEIDYEHLPLTTQLAEHGIRQLELDVYADPEGGRFADRPALAVVGLPTASGEPALEEPGFKTLHIADIDFRATCVTFVACLEEVEAWSSANPDHLPVMIMVEAKADSLAAQGAAAGVDVEALGIPTTDVLPMTRELFDDLEAEILSVFDEDRLITPDDVRGDHDTLEEAVLTGEAWPTVDDALGKVLFSLVDLGPTRDTYVGDATALEGRLLFTSSEEGRPDAAFIRIDDALIEGDRIKAAVGAGYLVRTRADIPAQEAATGDTNRRDAALASGGHFVSTDHYVADPELGTGYLVEMPGALDGVAARCNPILAPPSCDTAKLSPRPSA